MIYVGVKGMQNKDLMTGYEVRVYKNLPKSEADVIKDQRMFASTLRNVLGSTFENELETGETIDCSVATMMVIKKVGYLMKHPEKIDLKEFSAVLGESKVETAVSSIPSDAFKGLVDVEKNDDTNT